MRKMFWLLNIANSSYFVIELVILHWVMVLSNLSNLRTAKCTYNVMTMMGNTDIFEFTFDNDTNM